MKLKNYVSIAAGSLVLSTATSNASVLMSFSQVGSNVVLTTSGSLDYSAYIGDYSSVLGISNSGETYTTSRIITQSELFLVQEAYETGVSEWSYYQVVTGQTNTDFASFMNDLTLEDHSGYSVSGFNTMSLFQVDFLGLSFDTRALNEGTGMVDFDFSVTFENTTLDTLGLLAHNQNETINYWTSDHLAGTNSVNFIVNTAAVPEPSSLLLGSLGAFTLLARRRR